MKTVTLILFLTLLSSVAFSNTTENLSTIRVYVSNLRNDQGQIAVLLFSSEDGFPGEQSEALMAQTYPIENGEVVIEFTGIAHGEYAISIVHDEDMNKEMNTNFLGIPSEGYWISNNERGGAFGGPDFDNASFRVTEPVVVLIAHFDY